MKKITRKELVGLANDQYTRSGNHYRIKKTINLMEWFDPTKNDTYLVPGAQGKYMLRSPHDKDVEIEGAELMNPKAEIGSITIEEYEDDDDCGWVVSYGRWDEKFDLEAEALAFAKKKEREATR